jgi:hypothetical protein
MQIGSQVVDPELLCPGRFLSWFAVKEQDAGFDSLSIKDPGWKSQQSIDVGLFQQIRPAITFRNQRRLIKRRRGLFVGHLQKE